MERLAALDAGAAGRLVDPEGLAPRWD